MKTFTLLIYLLLADISVQNTTTGIENDAGVIIGIYDGLTENMLFQFTDDKGQVVLFDEVARNLEYDLYDEMNFGTKFKVTWEDRTIEVLDEDNEPTGGMKKIKLITALQKL